MRLLHVLLPIAGVAMALLWPALVRSQPAAPAALRWSESRAGTVVAADTGRVLRTARQAGAMTLEAGAWLVVPARPGQWVRVLGEVGALGLGRMPAERLETALWLRSTKGGSGELTLQVPYWADAPVAVIRGAGSEAAELTAHVATADDPATAMAWLRADEAIDAWLAGGPTPPSVPASASRTVRLLTLARRLLGDEPPVRRWAQQRWWQDTAPLRPRPAPYFGATPAELEGGQVPAEAGGRIVRDGGVVRLQAGDGEVVAIEIDAAPAAAAEVRIHRGDALAQVLRWGRPRGEPSEAWPSAEPGLRRRTARLAGPGELRVVVEGGPVHVLATRHRRYATWSSLLAPSIDGEGPMPLDSYGALVARTAGLPRDDDRRLVLSAVLAFTAPDATAAARHAAEVFAAPGAAADRALVSAAVIEHLLDLDLHADGFGSAALTGGDADDVTLVQAWAATGGGDTEPRSAAPLLFETMAERHPAQARWGLLAARAWRDTTSLQTLSPEGAAATSRQWQALAGGRCDVRTPSGNPRWTVLEPGAATFAVDTDEGGPAHVLLQAPSSELVVAIDGVPVTVHGSVGLMGRALVAPGRRRFTVPDDAPPLLARIPRSGEAACSTLREVRTCHLLTGPVRYELPGAGRPTVLRLARSSPDEGDGLSLRITTDRALSAWLAADGAELDVPVAAGVTEVRVEPARPVTLCAWMRAQPVAAEARAPLRPSPAVDTETLLATVRASTGRLRAHPDDDETAAARGAALSALGFQRYAALDGVAAPPAPETLPESASAAPIDLASRLPPLAAPAEAVARAVAAWRGGDARGVVAALGAEAVTQPEQVAGDASALLLALAAERAAGRGDDPQMSAVAGAAFLALGRRTGDGEALHRAANHLVDAAAATGDRAATLRAYVTARLAVAAGDEPEAALARLGRAIGWRVVRRVDRAAGTAVVRVVGREVSLAERVRAALSLAPEGARLFDEDRTAEVMPRASTALALEGGCVRVAPGWPACTLQVTVNGAAAPCEGGRCRLEVDGAARVLVGVERDGEAVAWLAASEGGRPIGSQVQSAWHQLTAEEPLRLAFVGPTVLRLRARGLAGVADALEVDVDGASGVVALETAPDPTTERLRVRGGADLTREVVHYLPIPDAGRHELTVRPRGGAALLRVALAVAREAPRARTLAPEAPTDTVEAPLDASADAILPAQADVPVTLVARLRGVAPNLLDDDRLTETTERSARLYLEHELGLTSELVEGVLWGEAATLVRLRDGPTSFGGEASLELGAGFPAPGLILQGRVMAQRAGDEGFAVGLLGRAELDYDLPLGPRLWLRPATSATFVRADEAARDVDGLDRAVFNPYSASHPRFVESELGLVGRPLVDTRLALVAATRSSPELDALDRLDFDAQATTLPGAGWWPELQLRYRLSVRPETEERAALFVRHTLRFEPTFWRWVDGGHRFLLGGHVQVLWDAPAPPTSLPPMSGLVMLGYDHAGQRGLRDVRPSTLFFRDRLEE